MAEQRALGRSGISVPKIIFGGNVFGWTIDEAASFRLLDALVENGLTAIDTADVYSRWAPGNRGGESEIIIGKWLKSRGCRDKVAILTKVGLEIAGKKGLAKARILSAIDESLLRLQTDHVDLYQAHRDDPSVPLEETLDAFAQLIKAGKVRAIGASNYSAARLGEALAVSRRDGLPRFETLQPHYNLRHRAEFETESAALCVREEIGVIPYYALASGFLTGKYRNEADFGKSQRGATVKTMLDARGRAILAALDEVAAQYAAQYRATCAQVALAWLAAKPAVAAPIASATSAAQLEDLVKATRLVLGADAMARLDAASA